MICNISRQRHIYVSSYDSIKLQSKNYTRWASFNIDKYAISSSLTLSIYYIILKYAPQIRENVHLTHGGAQGVYREGCLQSFGRRR